MNEICSETITTTEVWYLTVGDGYLISVQDYPGEIPACRRHTDKSLTVVGPFTSYGGVIRYLRYNWIRQAENANIPAAPLTIQEERPYPTILRRVLDVTSQWCENEILKQRGEREIDKLICVIRRRGSDWEPEHSDAEQRALANNEFYTNPDCQRVEFWVGNAVDAQKSGHGVVVYTATHTLDYWHRSY